ncbi:unnamed protein product [Rotaria sordida]|uniref:DOMON domain-containing protein n=1 Tax=Rotaria sordida TaxID=392033 RepID=A0A815RUD0_9BILA|nr:unnamed protein product [Rotaria sordida]
MYLVYSFYTILFLYWTVNKAQCLSSPIQPFSEYESAIELEPNMIDLHWTANEEEIVFELHMKTLGWIALGLRGGMRGADIGVGWISDGKIHFEDRFATGFITPIIDNTTTDWFALNGKEENGWTAIQFKRKVDTCDPMDVAIKFGTNTLIYAYGLEDPNPNINYHETRRGSRILPLINYSNPPPESKFGSLEKYEFRFDNLERALKIEQKRTFFVSK